MDKANKNQKGFLSKAWKLRGTLVRYIGLFGIPLLLGTVPKAAFNAKAMNPDAGLVDILTNLWGTMGSNIAEFAIPGGSIIFSETGKAVSSIFNAVTGAAPFSSAVAPIVPQL